MMRNGWKKAFQVAVMGLAISSFGCGSNGDGGSSSSSQVITVSGTVLSPNGQLAKAGTSWPRNWLASLLSPKQSLAQVTGWSPVPNATVRVFRIDDTGSPVGSVLVSGTTDGNGNFSLTLPPGVPLGPDLVVQVWNGPGPVTVGTTNSMTLPLTQTNVQLDPATEASMRALIQRTAPDGGETLADLTLEEVNDYMAGYQTVVDYFPPPSGTFEAQVSNITTRLASRMGQALDVLLTPGTNWIMTELIPDLPDGVTGMPYQARILIVGGQPPRTFNFLDPPPLGLSTDSTGLISGTPTQSGTFYMDYMVKDSSSPVPFNLGTNVRITINPGPNPTASFTATPLPVEIFRVVDFDASNSSDSDGTVTLYEWDFTNDGIIDATGVTTQFTYNTAGTFTARLRVTDNDGLVGESTHTVQVLPPPGSGRIAAGNRFSYARTNAWALYSWGTDLSEAQGNGTGNNPRNAPGPVSGISNAIGLVKLYGGAGHGLAIRSNGDVWGWGINTSGQLGNNSTATQATPVPMQDSMGATVGGAVMVSGGAFHSLILRWDGTVLSTGLYPGDGSTTYRTHAEPVPGLSDIVAVASGAGASYVVRDDGTVWAWGDNTNGALGDATTDNRSTPVQITGLSNIVAVSAGNQFAIALDTHGDVWSWGTNASGQLGDGSSVVNRTTPSKVTISGVTAIATGIEHALAVMSDGTVRAWGENANGRLGLGDQDDRSVPAAISNLTSVVAIAGGNGHSLAVRSNGEVWAWGSNVSGELGLGFTGGQSLTPQKVPGLNLN